MKRVYEKPSLAIELFETESILTASDNVFANQNGSPMIEIAEGSTITLSAGQVLESINYADFKKK